MFFLCHYAENVPLAEVYKYKKTYLRWRKKNVTCDAVDRHAFIFMRCPSVGTFRQDGVLVTHRLRLCSDLVLQGSSKASLRPSSGPRLGLFYGFHYKNINSL